MVDAALGGAEDARDAVQVMRFHLDEPTWTLLEDDPVVVSQQITDVVVDLVGEPGAQQLVVSFDHDAAMSFHEDGEPVAFGVEKQMTYSLTPSPIEDGPAWLIAEFDGEFDVVE